MMQFGIIGLGVVGLGAGAAAALLFASVTSGAWLSIALFYLAPLPILIAGLGWTHWAAPHAGVGPAVAAAACTILVSMAPFSLTAPLYYSTTIRASGAVYGLLLAYVLPLPNRPLPSFLLFPLLARYAGMISGGLALVRSTACPPDAPRAPGGQGPDPGNLRVGTPGGTKPAFRPASSSRTTSATSWRRCVCS